jgi:hypothetical protein
MFLFFQSGDKCAIISRLGLGSKSRFDYPSYMLPMPTVKRKKSKAKSIVRKQVRVKEKWDHDDDKPPPLINQCDEADSSDKEDEDELPLPPKKYKKIKKIHLRLRALLSADNFTGHDLSITASVYDARNDPEFPIVINSRASISMIPYLKDCIGTLQFSQTNQFYCLSKGLEVSGQGKVI